MSASCWVDERVRATGERRALKLVIDELAGNNALASLHTQMQHAIERIKELHRGELALEVLQHVNHDVVRCGERVEADPVARHGQRSVFERGGITCIVRATHGHDGGSTIGANMLIRVALDAEVLGLNRATQRIARRVTRSGAARICVTSLHVQGLGESLGTGVAQLSTRAARRGGRRQQRYLRHLRLVGSAKRVRARRGIRLQRSAIDGMPRLSDGNAGRWRPGKGSRVFSRNVATWRAGACDETVTVAIVAAANATAAEGGPRP